MHTLPIADAKLPALPSVRAFGYARTSPSKHTHNGIDLPAPKGTRVASSEAGVVTHASRVWRQGFTGYGRHVVVKHGDGTHALYAHLDEVSVKPGDYVTAGAKLGTVGNTRFTKADHEATFKSSGFHLHFEVSPRPYPQDNTKPRLDPVAWLRGENPRLEPEDEKPVDDGGGNGNDLGPLIVALVTLALGAMAAS